MEKLSKEELVLLEMSVEKILIFLHRIHMKEKPYFLKHIENMKNNMEICFILDFDGWEQLEGLLKRDWKAANHEITGIPGFIIQAETRERKSELDCKFIELISEVECFFAHSF